MQNLLKKLFLILTVIIAIYFGVYFIIFGIFGSWQHTRHEVYYFNNDKSYYTDEVRDSLLYNKYPATVSLIDPIFIIPNNTWRIIQARPCTLSEKETCKKYQEYFPMVSRGIVGTRWGNIHMEQLNPINLATPVKPIKNTDLLWR